MDDNVPTINHQQSELIPPEGHENVGYTAFDILVEILEDKNEMGLPEKWNRASELTRNKHWKQKAGKPGLVTANLLFSHRQRTVNMLTDNNPTFNVSKLGSADGNEDAYDAMLRTCEHWWRDQEQQHVLEMSVGSAEEQGAVVEKCVFNDEIELIGEVETQVVPLFNFGIYPVKCTDIRKAEAALHYYPMSIREARRRWPEMAEHIVADSEILKEIGDLRREIAASASGKDKGYLSTFVSAIKNVVNSAGDGGEEGDEVLVVEAWVKDYTKVPGPPKLDADGNAVEEVMVSKYTGNIRRIQTCCAGKVVLSDMSNPSINPNIPLDKVVNCYLYDKFPFSITSSINNDVSAWGMSDYEQLEQLNVEVNKSLSQITMMKDKASRLKIINPKDSGVPNTAFTNRPGIIRPANAMVANAIRYMDLPNIPAELVTVMDIYKDLFYTVSGSFEIEQAQKPGREVIAYKAIAALLERASTMLKGKIRNYSKMIRERGRMFVSLAQNWYTEERWITYEEDGADQTMAVTSSILLAPAKMTVVSGSTMPRAKIQEREEAIALFKLGAIDGEELLKRLEWPDRKNLTKRLAMGPLGDLLKKLGALGAPPQFLQYLKMVADADMKEIEKALKTGKMPTIPMMLQAMMTGKDPAAEMENAQKQIELNKQQSEIMLNIERSKTEKVKQIVQIAGIQFDAEIVQQNWTKIDAMISDNREKQLLGGFNAGVKAAQGVKSDKGPYNESGMGSNNKV
jgi:hypothetical protein